MELVFEMYNPTGTTQKSFLHFLKNTIECMYATKVYIVGDGLCIRKERHINFSKGKIVDEKLGD